MTRPVVEASTSTRRAMGASGAHPAVAGEAIPADRVRLDLLVAGSPPCPPHQRAIEEIDRAAALLGPELEARGTRLQVRVTTGVDPAVPGLELRVDGVTVRPQGLHRCARGEGPSCGSYAWEGRTCSAPPAELLTAAVQDRLDLRDRLRQAP